MLLAVKHIKFTVRSTVTHRKYSNSYRLNQLGVEKTHHSNAQQLLSPFTKDKRVIDYVDKHIRWMQPERVVICDGSLAEKKQLEEELVGKGTLIRLSEKLRPGSFLARSHPGDVARIEDRTFICSKDKIDAGPTNNWRDPSETKQHLDKLFNQSMKGRTLYVIPFCMGPLDSEFSKTGVQITDSAYVVLNMRIMTRMGEMVWKMIENQDFVHAVHSVGLPILDKVRDDVPWPCNPSSTIICHFPETLEIYSFGSGYGGNALLGKKCFALRIASYMAKNEGWLAEHMLIGGVTSPEGKKHYFTGSFPSACGKTNLAMLQSNLSGWKVECVGDDIAWIRISNGQMLAINPESGFFGVAPGTSADSNPNAMETVSRNTLFTNVALTDDGDVWWEGMTRNPPNHLTDWTGTSWTPVAVRTAAHPNARFTVAASQAPTMDERWEDPRGVEISAVLFGGRRATHVPLVYGSRSWQHGVFMGSSMSSETTAAAAGKVGQLRHDPFAMLPFCGYNMADYFKHWLHMGKKHESNAAKLPKFYYVNWFRKDENGGWLWPGFGDNVRVLKWVFEDKEGRSKNHSQSTPIGEVPTPESLDLTNLKMDSQKLKTLLSVNKDEWKGEVKEIESYYKKFGDKLPQELWKELKDLEQRVN